MLGRLNLLNLKNCQIETIQDNAFNNLGSLRVLQLTNNKLTSIDGPEMKGLNLLESLDLSNNLINKIGEMPFSALSKLDELNLDNNKLTTVGSGLSENLPPLVKLLFLRNNQISNVAESKFQRFEKLYLDNNLIQRIDENTFGYLPRDEAKEIYIKNNKISVIDPRVLQKFQGDYHLVLEKNVCVDGKFNITDGNQDQLRNDLFMDSCFLSSMSEDTVVDCKNEECRAELVFFQDPGYFNFALNLTTEGSEDDVRSLKFIESRFPEIPMALLIKLSKLTSLEVTSVRLAVLHPLKYCSLLEHFDASHNNLEVLHSNTFGDCQNLKTINLSSNQIKTIEKNVFQRLLKLEHLNLNDNNIVIVKQELFAKIITLKNLELANSNIAAVERGTFDKIAELYDLMDLRGNLCIDKNYPVRVKSSEFHEDMKVCYENSGSGHIKVGMITVAPLFLVIFKLLKY